MAGVNLERIVCRSVNGGDTDLDLLHEALRARVLPSHGPRSWWHDRALLLGAALVTAQRAAYGAAPHLSSTTVSCFPGSASARQRAARAFFLRHHFGVETDFLGRQTRRRPTRPNRAWWRWWLRGVWWGLLGLLDWSARRYAWLGGVLVDMQLLKRLEPELEHAYVFSLYDRRQYLLLTFLARHTSLSVHAVYQSIPLARNCRHLHVPVNVVLTSRVNLAEVDYYRRSGTFKPGAVRYAGQEYIIDTKDLTPHAPLYDIGYYSSGEWARREGLYQPDDLDRVRRGAYLTNRYALVASEHLQALARYAHEHRRTLRIYLHPMERRLLSQHRIEPPYAALADGDLVSLDTGAESSRHSMYDTRVAVSLQSSIIWERLDLGLSSSFIYEFPDASANVFERAALGEFAENTYRTVDELLAKIARALETHPENTAIP